MSAGLVGASVYAACCRVEIATCIVSLRPREVVMSDGQCADGQGLGYLRAPGKGGAIWQQTPPQASWINQLVWDLNEVVDMTRRSPTKDWGC